MNEENMIWKNRYEILKARISDIEIETRQERLPKETERAWKIADRIFVSFLHDVCDSEESAIKIFGEGNYDVYRLEKAADKADD